MSFPTRERGLKSVYAGGVTGVEGRSPRGNVDWNTTLEHRTIGEIVVPHAGTWIEIEMIPALFVEVRVVPHAGTWIEI